MPSSWCVILLVHAAAPLFCGVWAWRPRRALCFERLLGGPAVVRGRWCLHGGSPLLSEEFFFHSLRFRRRAVIAVCHLVVVGVADSDRCLGTILFVALLMIRCPPSPSLPLSVALGMCASLAPPTRRRSSTRLDFCPCVCRVRDVPIRARAHSCACGGFASISGGRAKVPEHLLPGERVPQAHPPQGDPVQDWEGFQVCAGQASLRPEAERVRWSDQARVPQEGT